VPPNAQLGLIKAACDGKTAKGILAQKPLGMNYAEAERQSRRARLPDHPRRESEHAFTTTQSAPPNTARKRNHRRAVFATIEMRGIPHWMDWQKDLAG